jgi:TetR/AcrR family tetracycline transcriptional repressor
MSTATRRPGTSAGLTLSRIVDAARGIDPEDLTLQAVATRLGVDRKAVAYHVTDREGLLDLCAADAVGSRLAATRFPADLSWQDALRRAAQAAADALIEAGIVAHWFRLDSLPGTGALVATNELLTRLLVAGFDELGAARVLSLTINCALGHARDVVLQARRGGHPQDRDLEGVLAMPGSEGLDALAVVAQERERTFEPAQLDFDLDVIIDGLAQRVG